MEKQKYSEKRKLTQLSDAIADLLVKQVQHEWKNEILYRNFYIWCKVKTLKGHAEYFNKRRKEEHWHRKLIYDYLISANYEFVIPEIPYQGVEVEGESPKDQLLFIHKYVLNREIETTDMLKVISDSSLKESDHATYKMIQELVIEQIEEEDLSNEVLDLFVLSDDILYIDEKIGKLL